MRSIKPGRFVNTPHGAGVIFEMRDMSAIVVHLIDESGETVLERTYKVEDIELTDKPLKTRVAVKK